MPDRMLQFVRVSQQTPEKRQPDARREDFAEIYADFAPEKAAEQASRYSQCGVPFCQVHCPLSQNIPDWLKLTAEGRLEEAFEINAATNTFPEVCGRVCPQDRLCEGNCVIEKGFESVTIGAVEDQLRRRGYQVHVYDRHDRAGGLMMYGIPGFKLEKEIVLRRWRLFEEAGIRFHLGVELGRDLSFADLRARHDAVLIACVPPSGKARPP